MFCYLWVKTALPLVFQSRWIFLPPSLPLFLSSFSFPCLTVLGEIWQKWVELLSTHPWFCACSWGRKWQPTPVFLPGKSHGQRSLAGYSPRGCKRVGHDRATKTTKQDNNSEYLLWRGSLNFCEFNKNNSKWFFWYIS